MVLSWPWLAQEAYSEFNIYYIFSFILNIIGIIIYKSSDPKDNFSVEFSKEQNKDQLTKMNKRNQERYAKETEKIVYYVNNNNNNSPRTTLSPTTTTTTTSLKKDTSFRDISLNEDEEEDDDNPKMSKESKDK